MKAEDVLSETVTRTVCIPADELTPGQIARHVIRTFRRRTRRMPTIGQMLIAAAEHDPPLPLLRSTAAQCLREWKIKMLSSRLHP